MEVPRTLRAEYARARQPERRPRMVKMEIEADTPEELGEAVRMLTEPPDIEISRPKFAKLAVQAGRPTEATRDTCEAGPSC